MRKSGLADSPFFSKAPPGFTPPTPPRKRISAGEKENRPEKGADRPVDRPTDQPVDRSTDQPTAQSTSQSTDRPIGKSFTVDALGPVVARPSSFYITQKLDRWLDEGVRYLREKGLHKADRSVLVNTLLHDPDLYKPAKLDKLRERVLVHMTNRTLRRSESTK